MPLELQGFKAWISCGDDEIACHGIENSEDGKEVTCWIASEEGKEFVVKWTGSTRLCESVTVGWLHVDDIDAGGLDMGSKVSSDSVYMLDGFPVSATTIRPFMFGSLTLTAIDDDAFLGISPPTRLGNITLAMWRGRVELTGCSKSWRAAPEEQQVHERTKKAALHRVKLGPETKSKAVIHNDTVLFLDKNPIVTFTFKYRPHDVLQANGILPVQVDKKRKAVDVPKEELLSEDELEESDAERDARIKALEDELRTLRSKPSGSGKSKAKRVKVESLIPEGFVSGEVIDLT